MRDRKRPFAGASSSAKAPLEKVTAVEMSALPAERDMSCKK